MNTPNLKSLSILFLFILIFVFPGCAEKQAIQIEEKAMCEQEKFGFHKLKQVTHCDADTCITNPEISIWNKPFQTGDTIAIVVSARFTSFDAQLLSGKPVYVSIKSVSGDQETFLLDGKLLPGQIIIEGLEYFHSVIPYSVDHSNSPVLGNNLLEIRPTGDTLIASYRSYCTDAVVEDTAVIISK